MPYLNESYFTCDGIKCPSCYGPKGTGVTVRLLPTPAIVWAKCNDNDCELSVKHRVTLLLKALVAWEEQKNG